MFSATFYVMQIYVESTRTWYYGDFATRLSFSFDPTSVTFSYIGSENPLNLKHCKQCVVVAVQTWEEQLVRDIKIFRYR